MSGILQGEELSDSTRMDADEQREAANATSPFFLCPIQPPELLDASNGTRTRQDASATLVDGVEWTVHLSPVAPALWVLTGCRLGECSRVVPLPFST